MNIIILHVFTLITLPMYGMSCHEEVRSDEIVGLKYIKRGKLLLMLIHKHCGLWHNEFWCHLWSTFCLPKGLWPYLPWESVFLPEKACMRSMLVSSAGLQSPLYKPRLGHRQALPLQTGKKRVTRCQELRTCFYFNHLILGALCGKLWCWLCVCWLLGSSLWMTQRMG